MALPPIVTLLAAGSASAFMAWAIGAGSSGSTPFAPAVGAQAISIMRAGFIVGLLGLAGAVLQGHNVTEAVGRELVLGVEVTPLAATAALTIAAGLVAVGIGTGYPIATAFTVTGAVVGVGLGLGGQPAWAKYQQIGIYWLAVPVVGAGLAYGTARLLRSDRAPEEVIVPLLAGAVGAFVANLEFALLAPFDASGTLAGAAASLLPGPRLALRAAVTGLVGVLSTATVAAWIDDDETTGQRRFLLILGALVAFSAGGSQVGLAIGPLLPLLEPYRLPLAAVLLGGGIGLLIGSWTGAPRLIKSLARDYSSLGERRSIAALIPSFLLAQGAVLLGVPVSFNEIIVSAIVGSGFAAGVGSVSKRKMGLTVVAWVGSLAVALVAGYGVATLIS